MIIHRPSSERGVADFGWLKARYSFSFARYVDRTHMGFGPLRVMNEDRVAPGKGFDTHPHDNMEIITYVLDGRLEHRDSMGNGAQIHKGEFQCMSAGTGVTHSEFNPSDTEPLHLYQVWIVPEKRDISPSYEQKAFKDIVPGQLRLVVSPTGEEGSLRINQNAKVYFGIFDAGHSAELSPSDGRRFWLQVLRGNLQLATLQLGEGDGVALYDEKFVPLLSSSSAEVLLFDLP